MTCDSRQIVEGVTGVVQAAQGGTEVENSKNGFEIYSNVLNLAGAIARINFEVN